MSAVYFPKGTVQTKSAAGSHLMFRLSEQANAGAINEVNRLLVVEDQELRIAARELAENEEQHSPHIFIRVADQDYENRYKQYVLYTNCGVYRIGGGGENCAQFKVGSADRSIIEEYFKSKA